MLAYRSSVHASTGQTPHFLWTGREIRLPSDSRLPLVQQPRPLVTEYVSRLLDSIRHAHDLARTHLQTAHRKQKDYYDKKVFGTPVRVGQLVWLHTSVPHSGIPAKLHKEWKGPYKVERILTEATCIIRDPKQLSSRAMVVHFNKLKPYLSDQNNSGSQDNQEIPDIALELEIPPEGGSGRPPGSEFLTEGGSVAVHSND